MPHSMQVFRALRRSWPAPLAMLLAVRAIAAPVMERDVIAAGGNFVTGGGMTLGMTMGETVVGLAFPVAGAFSEVAGFWGPGALPIVGVFDPPPAPADRFGFEATPNPFADGLVIRLALPAGVSAASVRAAIFDTRGRRVRALDPPRGQDRFTLLWDGRDRDGREAPNGIYFCRVEAGGFAVVRRVVRVR